MYKEKPNFFVLFASAIAIFVISMDIANANISTPFIADSFHLTINCASLVLLTYYLALTSLLLPFGRLSDLKGTMKVLKIGFVIFIFGSFFSGLSTNIWLLGVFRFCQGIGGAMLLTTYGATVTKYLPSYFTGRAFGVITIFAGAGFAFGFLLGGLLIRYYSWRLGFLINIPFCVIGLFLLKEYFVDIREISQQNAMKKFDVIGSVLISIVFFLLAYLLNQFNNILVLYIFAIIVVGIICFIFFVYRVKNCPNPLIDINLIKDSALLFAFISVAIVNMVFDGFNFIVPFYLKMIKQLPAAEIGIILTILPITSLFAGFGIGYCIDKCGAQRNIIFSTVMLVLSSMLFFCFQQYTSLIYIIISLIVLGVVIAIFFTANITFIMGHANSENAGMVASIKAVVSYFGGFVSIAIFAQILSGNYIIKSEAIHKVSAQYNLMMHFRYACLFSVVLSVIVCFLSFFSKQRKCQNS
ncbi:MAG: MFS transporter [Gammaproteobacteria bacterium]|jgi:MFS family permease